ncbi:MAG: PD40 domain-containing protein [Gemmatimonadales bacterium]|nr:PD40 domain-containing protein [Gemmatimonadales bacterium]
MRLFMTGGRAALLVCAVLNAGCGHTEPASFVPPPPDGTFNATSPVRLTYNPAMDVAASFSDDGKFIVYTYSVAGRRDRDRCLGIIPSGGGTRLFERCETRLAYNDSSDTFTSAALAADGRLLYLRATSRIATQVPSGTGLYLAPAPDAPGQLLLTLPVAVGGQTATWLADIRWSGPSGFTALAQQITVVPTCPGCGARDTVFVPLFVARGTINAGAATLQAIAGTEGAISYALSSDGTQMLLARGGTTLELLPASGGTATTVATIPIGTPTDRITGLGCARDLCIVSTMFGRVPPAAPGLSYALYSGAFTGGPLTQRAQSDAAIWTRPRLSPSSTDILVQAELGAARDLYLFRGLL